MGGTQVNTKDIQYDRHTVSLLTDHMVITPKYRGKIPTGEAAFVTEAIIRGTSLKWVEKYISSQNLPTVRKVYWQKTLSSLQVRGIGTADDGGFMLV